jgi:hypothetical protein
MWASWEEAENSFPDNRTILDKTSPAREFQASDFNARMRRRSSRYSDAFEDDSHSSVSDAEKKRVAVDIEGARYNEPVWTDTQPIQLIINSQSRFEITPEGREYFNLNLANRRLVILTVCGLYRTGKSYLLNLLSGRIGPSSARQSSRLLLPTSGTVEACTSGIWIWNSSAERDESAPVYVLVDCEGSGNTANARDHDARLFAIAMLMSSYFMYNSKGVIDETSLSNLALVTSVASSVMKESSNQRLKPKFMWVLRDFVLSLEDSTGQEISSTAYIESKLKSGKVYKQALSQLFSSLDCTTLVTPVTDEAKLQRLIELKWEELRPEFRTEIYSLRSKLLRDAKTKKSFDGQTELTGKEFIQLLDKVIESINSGDIPSIESLWKQVQGSQVEETVFELTRGYEKRISQIHLPMDQTDIETLVDQYRRDVIKKFKSMVGEASNARNDLVFNIVDINRRLFEANKLKTHERAELLLRQLWREDIVNLLRNCNRSDVNEEFIRDRIELLKDKYFHQAIGVYDIIQKCYDDNILPRYEKLMTELRNPGFQDTSNVSSMNPVFTSSPKKSSNGCMHKSFSRCVIM